MPRSKDKIKKEGFLPLTYLLFAAATLVTFGLCLSLGSVMVPISEWRTSQIILGVRLPRVICAGLVGALLSISGASMQGLLKNPLADGTTLGVSAGASVGAVAAIVLGITIPGLPFAGTTVFASLFAFLSLAVILALSYRLDSGLSTDTIILIGVIFSMFAASITSVLITYAGEKAKNIVHWTLGSLASQSYANMWLLLVSGAVFGGILLLHAKELNAFAVGEENARNVGVSVGRVKLTVLIAVSIQIGVCVSVSGSIGFVGLVVPHMVRMITGPNHKRLLPGAIFGGAIFLMLCDLAARTLFSPRELPIGVVTSLVGAVLFIRIFFAKRAAR
ncbi:MAG: iron ABC transporter permease [Oscillospiraceae bacterium]|nr:iron ABC transporter permease [Oscillospiraceae bacterium]